MVGIASKNMLKDLLIGSTSQLAHFWPKKNTKVISSRSINIDYIRRNQWNRIYFAFSDGRTYLSDLCEFIQSNVIYPLNLIEQINDCCNKIVFFSTAELWNLHNGSINFGDKKQIWKSFNYVHSPYILSKAIVTEIILRDRATYRKVIILFPFTFNCAFRKDKDFLLTSVFDSIINKKKIKVGNIRTYREFLHPKFVIQQSLKAENHQIIGSGRLIFVYDFIKKLYNAFNMNMNDYVTEDEDFEHISSKRGICFLDSKECLYSEEQLLNDTVDDIEKVIKEKK